MHLCTYETLLTPVCIHFYTTTLIVQWDIHINSSTPRIHTYTFTLRLPAYCTIAIISSHLIPFFPTSSLTYVSNAFLDFHLLLFPHQFHLKNFSCQSILCTHAPTISFVFSQPSLQLKPKICGKISCRILSFLVFPSILLINFISNVFCLILLCIS